MLNRLANIATVVIALCAITVAATSLRQRSGPAARGPGADTVRVSNWPDLLRYGHSMGPENARVTIVEFGDYECPYCAAAEPQVEAFLASTPSVRFVFRHWPLLGHRFAAPAARAAECAGQQQRFWEMHRTLFASHDSLGLIPFPMLARRAGVPDSAAFSRCLADSKSLVQIDAGRADAHNAGADGTPTFIVNGLRIATALDTAFLRRLVTQAQVAAH